MINNSFNKRLFFIQFVKIFFCNNNFCSSLACCFIEEKYGCNEKKTRYTNAQQKPINEVVMNVKPKRYKQKAVYLQYDSGLESDPYTSDSNAVYDIQQIKCLKKNEVYDTIWE